MRRFFLIALAVLICSAASGQKSSTQSRKARLQQEIEMLDRQLKENAAKSSSALTALNLVRRKVTNGRQLVAESDGELSVLKDSLQAKQKEIDKLQSRLDTMTVYYDRLVKSAYKNRDARKWYMYLLASSSLSQASHRYAYLKNISVQMNAQAEAIKEAKSELEAEKLRIEEIKSKAQKVRDSRAADLNRLRKDEKESENLISRLKKDKSKYQKQLADKKRQMEALNREVDKAISSAVGGAKKGAKTSTAVDQKLSNEFASNKGRLPWPVEGVIVESYGQHYHPVYKSVKLPFNKGVNVSVNPGSTVKAVFNGTVKQIIVMPGYNQCVLVQHGSYFTFYCKLNSVSVKSGDKVTTGQAIGTVDTINGETQLHFQLWSGRNPQDPELWLK